MEKLDELQRSQAHSVEVILNALSKQGSPAVDVLSALSAKDMDQKTEDSTERPIASIPTSEDFRAPSSENVSTPMEPPRPPVMSDLAIPMGHTTAAQNLLKWPQIRRLVGDVDEKYVINAEKSRGLLRLYGRGEGDDKDDGGAGPSSPASMGGAEYTPESNPDLPVNSVWGTDYVPPIVGDNRSERGSIPVGGLLRDGTLNVDSGEVRRLHQSYLAHIHILHPFMDKKVLGKLMTNFISKYSHSRVSRPAAAQPPFSPPFDNPSGPILSGSSLKRKRSGDGPGIGIRHPATEDSEYVYQPKPVNGPQFERSISTAISLLVLALGKVCEWNKPLPGPVRDGVGDNTSNPRSHSLPIGHGESPVTAPAVPSPASIQSPSGSSRPSPQYSISTRAYGDRNLDVIPGLAYFAKATDILGNLKGGYDLPHIQANLMAGLYAGQLAHVFSSHDYISDACRACQVLLKTFVSF